MPTCSSPSSLLQAFQDGYTLRDTTQADEFMQLFTKNAEVIGTNGLRPGSGEWYTDRISARELVHDDWESWGDVRLLLEESHIDQVGDAAWCACPATVTQHFGRDHFQSYLNFIKNYIETSPLPAEEKLHYILRGGNNTIYELARGEKFVWALRITFLMVKEEDGWKFAQVHFSFPTITFPDVRIFEKGDIQ